MGKRPGEQRAFFSKAVDIGRFKMGALIAAQTVWSQGIYGNEKNIQLRILYFLLAFWKGMEEKIKKEQADENDQNKEEISFAYFYFSQLVLLNVSINPRLKTRDF
jgi:hypothetical protein